MGIWDRFSRMMKSNINDAIDKAEDPEKMLKQIVEELNTDLMGVKTQVATAIATEKQLYAKAQQLQQEADQWAKKAELAVSKGDDELAREALQRKATAQQTADGFKNQWEEAKKSVAMLKENLSRLEAKISEAQTKKDLLIARNRRAEAEKRIQTTLSRSGSSNALSAFDRLEAKVNEKEAQAAAYGELNASSLESRFEALSAPNVDDELAALKAKHDQALLPEQT